MCGYHLNIDTGTPKSVEVVSPQGTQIHVEEGETVAGCIEACATVIGNDIQEWGCDEPDSVS